ncbi:hypothetical protein MW887_003483 [Aspergillus wentii]|nr:hypothetical protein MW887_003483 [Aspergillus wentii]
MRPLLLTVILLAVAKAQAAAVFAHFMMSNTGNYSTSDWEDDLKLAKDAHIDAFALNIAYGNPVNDKAISTAFNVAQNIEFQLFFSFDYAGGGAWPQEDVIKLLETYTPSEAYYRHDKKPFVSTFEGPSNADDWKVIKKITGCFFMPDWSSLGAKKALETGAGVVDGLFSWAAWPWGPNDMQTYDDASYLQYLNQSGIAMPYMMPVSPWFYTNLPRYNKNWLWRGDDLWYHRWNQVHYVKPEFVEILTWNDYGESHYIGPLRDHTFEAFDNAPFNYAADMPHDGWRLFLPFVIDQYKTGTAKIDKEGIVAWYRLQPALFCNDGDTSGNTASQLQYEFDAQIIMHDNVYFSALLGSEADVTVSVGGKKLPASWTWKPDGGVGIYHGSAKISGETGPVLVTISRNHRNLAQVKGKEITIDCDKFHGMANFNAWVGSAQSSDSISASPHLSLADQVCINGTALVNFKDLCEYSCEYGYCPIGACTCRAMGAQRPEPNITNVHGYPISGEDENYSGLCSWDCNHGFCPDNACGTVKVPLTTPKVSDFTPHACIEGSGQGGLADLCEFSCRYGFCPISSCKCNKTGDLVEAPSSTTVTASAASGREATLYEELCGFACSHGYCPTSACATKTPIPTGRGGQVVHVDPAVWKDENPEMTCEPPCVLIPAPLTLDKPTTISFPPLTTAVTYYSEATKTLTVSKGSTKLYPSYSLVTAPTVININPITDTTIDVWAITVTSGMPEQIYMTSSVQPSPVTLTVTPHENPSCYLCIIGGTTKITGATTKTIDVTTLTYDSSTWITGGYVETVGGSTTVLDGETQKPTVTIVTPHPYPTTTDKKPDPVLNTRTTKHKTGPPAPLCTKGCGHGCKLFCIPGCPLCPPGFGGVGGAAGGGSNENPPSGDRDGETTTSETSSTATITAAEYGIGVRDRVPKRGLKRNTSQESKISATLSSLYGDVQKHASDGWVTSFPSRTTHAATTTEPPTTTKPPIHKGDLSTGMVVATHKACPDSHNCSYEYAVYTVTFPDWYSYPTCSPQKAIYTTTVPASKTKNLIIGPFDIDGSTECFYKNRDFDCKKSGHCYSCQGGACKGQCGSDTWEVDGSCRW